jgi:hypothetical protein
LKPLYLSRTANACALPPSLLMAGGDIGKTARSIALNRTFRRGACTAHLLAGVEVAS